MKDSKNDKHNQGFRILANMGNSLPYSAWSTSSLNDEYNRLLSQITIEKEMIVFAHKQTPINLEYIESKMKSISAAAIDLVNIANEIDEKKIRVGFP